MRAISASWGGKTYTVPENKVFALGEEIEDICTIPELPDLVKRFKLRKLSRIYATVINFAGGSVTNEEVHSEFARMMKESPKDLADSLIAGVFAVLMEILMDGAPETADDGAVKKKAAGS